MTAEVIRFSDEMLKKHGIGFMLCPRCQDQSCFLPVVEIDQGGMYVSGLQCVGPNCAEEADGLNFSVTKGYVQGIDL